MEFDLNEPAQGFLPEDFEPWPFENVGEGSDDFHISIDELMWLDQQQQNLEEEEREVLEHFNISNLFDHNESPVDISSAQVNQRKPNAKPNLSNEVRTQIVVDILKVCDGIYNVPKGHFSKVATQYSVHRSTVHRIWKLAKEKLVNEAVIYVKNRKKVSCGRKPIVWDEELLKSIPQQKRTTIREFASALGVSPTTIVKLMKRGIVRSHTSNVRPTLKHHHLTRRIQFILGKIIPSLVTSLPRFECMYNIVHIDEKFFSGSRATQRYYLTTGENEPYRHAQSKHFIEKIMFIAAIARPVFDSNNECLFDGKIGIWAFTEEHVAVRTTANQRAGDIIIKPARSITKETIKEKIVNQLIPALKSKWPTFASKCIWIQQDNARPHISPNDPEFLQVAKTDGFDINLIYQPAQPPDLNCLDLGFFCAIQAIQYKKFPKDLSSLIKDVEDAYNEYDPKKINFT